MTISRKIVLHFSRRLVDQPIVSQLTKTYNLDFNILKASITQEKEGLMVLELTGSTENYDKGIQYLLNSGVKVQSMGSNVMRNEDKCTNCGACLTFCPADAFELNSKNMTVNFIEEKCIACEVCLKACPPRAMELHI